MKIAVVTDSTAYLNKEQVEKYNIRVVPIPFIIDDKVYNEGIDITTEEFYEKLRTCEKFPTPSQPPVGELVELYESLADEGYDTVISIHLAGTISGFVRTLETTVKDAVSDRINLIPYDSRITVLLMGYLVIEAARMAQNGAELDDILKRLDHLRDTIDEIFVVDDLQNLVRGGRLSNASAFIGSVLRIKPLLTFDDESDKIVAFEKVRSSKRALKRTEDLFEEKTENVGYPLRLIIFHANAEEAALEWRDRLSKKHPDYPIDISYFGPVIGTHLGEGSMGMGWYKI